MKTTRRSFLGTTLAGAAGLSMSGKEELTLTKASTPPLALLGGKPVRTEPFPSWPKIAANDEESWNEVLHKKRWCRLDGNCAKQFEEAWADKLGAR